MPSGTLPTDTSSVTQAPRGLPKNPVVLTVVIAGPLLLLAVASVFHPVNLTDSTAGVWFGLHLVLIPVFPLVGLAPWLIARQVDRRLGWLAAVFAFGYAAFYTSLDVLAGVGAGAVHLAGETDAKASLYAIGRTVAAIGVVSLICAAVVASIAGILRARLAAVPGAVLALAGAALLYRGHIYFGYGTLTMLLLAAGFTILAFAVSRDPAAPPAVRARR